MHKRNWGYFLLIMLVITGLAGRHHTETFSGKERRLLIKELKNAKAQLLQNIETLNTNQFRYKNHQGESIEKYLQELAATENELWNKAQEAMKHNAQIQNGSKFDEPLLSNKAYITSICSSLLEGSQHKHAHLSESETITQLKKQEAKLLRYLRTSTNDVHHQFANTPTGRLNIYELLMLDIACIQYYDQQIEKIKSSSKFPK